MIVLAIRTDSAQAQLMLYEGPRRKAVKSWSAGRQLSKQLLKTLTAFVRHSGYRMDDLDGLILYRGPGSFTGLRIGAAVANALAYALAIPIVGSSGKYWLEEGLKQLGAGEGRTQMAPDYGDEPHLTISKRS